MGIVVDLWFVEGWRPKGINEWIKLMKLIWWMVCFPRRGLLSLFQLHSFLHQPSIHQLCWMKLIGLIERNWICWKRREGSPAAQATISSFLHQSTNFICWIDWKKLKKIDCCSAAQRKQFINSTNKQIKIKIKFYFSLMVEFDELPLVFISPEIIGRAAPPLNQCAIHLLLIGCGICVCWLPAALVFFDLWERNGWLKRERAACFVDFIKRRKSWL